MGVKSRRLKNLAASTGLSGVGQRNLPFSPHNICETRPYPVVSIILETEKLIRNPLISRTMFLVMRQVTIFWSKNSFSFSNRYSNFLSQTFKEVS